MKGTGIRMKEMKHYGESSPTVLDGAVKCWIIFWGNSGGLVGELGSNGVATTQNCLENRENTTARIILGI